jgi:hypothetical protein
MLALLPSLRCHAAASRSALRALGGTVSPRRMRRPRARTAIAAVASRCQVPPHSPQTNCRVIRPRGGALPPDGRASRPPQWGHFEEVPSGFTQTICLRAL